MANLRGIPKASWDRKDVADRTRFKVTLCHIAGSRTVPETCNSLLTSVDFVATCTLSEKKPREVRHVKPLDGSAGEGGALSTLPKQGAR